MYKSNDPVMLMTASGPSDSSKQANMAAGDIGDTNPYLLPQTPSVGLKCMNQGYDFVWHANKKPFFVKPDGTHIYLTVGYYVPYYDVWDSESSTACPARTKPQSRPEGQVGESSASSDTSKSSVRSEDVPEEENTPSIAPLKDPEVHAMNFWQMTLATLTQTCMWSQ